MSLVAPSRRSVLQDVGPAGGFALVVAATIGANITLPFGASVGGLLAIATAPVWAVRLATNRWGRWIVAGVVLSIASGIVLTSLNSYDHATLQSSVIERSMLLVQLAACVGFLLWAHLLVGVSATTIAFGAGAAVGIAFGGGDGSWRFTYSIPLTLLVLAVASSTSRTWVQVSALGALAVVGLLNDSRSNSAFLLLSATLLVWQRLVAKGTRRSRGAGALVALAGVGGSVFLLLQTAIVEGYFGEATQARTAEQLERSGNLLLGGRPEAAASFALLTRYPLGMGSGIRANYQDIMIAKTGMAGIGYDPNNGYVERFMFGSAIEVHSMLGDLWLWFGLPGAALAVISAVLVLQGLARGYAHRALTALFVYLVTRSLWDLFFSPVSTSLRAWILVLSLAIAYTMYTIRPDSPSLSSLTAPVGRR